MPQDSTLDLTQCTVNDYAEHHLENFKMSDKGKSIFNNLIKKKYGDTSPKLTQALKQEYQYKCTNENQPLDESFLIRNGIEGKNISAAESQEKEKQERIDKLKNYTPKTLVYKLVNEAPKQINDILSIIKENTGTELTNEQMNSIRDNLYTEIYNPDPNKRKCGSIENPDFAEKFLQNYGSEFGCTNVTGDLKSQLPLEWQDTLSTYNEDKIRIGVNIPDSQIRNVAVELVANILGKKGVPNNPAYAKKTLLDVVDTVEQVAKEGNGEYLRRYIGNETHLEDVSRKFSNNDTKAYSHLAGDDQKCSRLATILDNTELGGLGSLAKGAGKTIGKLFGSTSQAETRNVSEPIYRRSNGTNVEQQEVDERTVASTNEMPLPLPLNPNNLIRKSSTDNNYTPPPPHNPESPGNKDRGK